MTEHDDALKSARRNILYVLYYSNIVPFRWHSQGLKCFYCKISISDSIALKIHTKSHSNENLEEFLKQNILSKDIPIKVDVTNLQCKLCEINIKDIDELVSHIVNIHDETGIEDISSCVIPFELNETQKSCIICHSQFDDIHLLVMHVVRQHVKQNFMCQICGQRFATRFRLARHIKSIHTLHKCVDCNKKFDTHKKLEIHQQLHGKIRVFSCNLCSFSFTNRYQLKVHMGREHNVEKYIFKCEFCSYICVTKGTMTLHIKLKHGSNSYQCDECDYKANLKWLITLHKNKHLGKKEYQCSLCGKTFARSSNLSAHMKIHTGNVGRVCRWCKHGFTDLDSLKEHEINSHTH